MIYISLLAFLPRRERPLLAGKIYIFSAMHFMLFQNYLTIIPRARMGSESIANEAEGRMGYRLRGHE